MVRTSKTPATTAPATPAKKKTVSKKSVELENCFIFQKFRQAFKPCIQKEEKCNTAKNHTCNRASSHPQCAVPSEENKRNKPQRCK